MSSTDSTDPGGLIAWRDLATPAEVADAIFDLYRRRGESNYDEVVSQTSHAAQCGQLALDDGANAPTIVAAFLHDIGHLLAGEHDDRDDFLERDLRHEEIGARFLSNWFGPEVTEPIRLHVPAKRYLCAVDRDYHAGLSEASVRSLVLQGGPMSPSEVIAFEKLDGRDRAVALRRWDDGAKVDGASTVSLATFRDLVESVASVPSS
ncbi:MAG: HD domain-containing protein [Actinomycetota bacterium]